MAVRPDDARLELTSYRSSDPDAIESFWVDRVRARVSFDRTVSTAAAFDFASAALGPFAVGSHRPHTDFRIRDDVENFYLFTTARDGYTGYTRRGVEHRTGAGRAVAFGPGHGPPTVHSAGGSDLSWLRIESWALERHLETLLGRPVVGHVGLAPQVDLHRGPGRTFLPLFEFIVAQASAADSVLHHPMVAGALFEAVLTGMLLATDHPYQDALRQPARPAGPRSVKRAVDAIQADPRQPYTAASLAELTGCGVRTLQAGFRLHLGMSPMTYLREVRLTRAHQDLRRDPMVGVAQVAARWGFTHLGRFAAAYAARYGTLPSHTRRAH
ncbi:MAG TPA: helix-turn-helix transcriptional regulator [Catenuloplanes sp.]|jgi:AraC-like DNA-binding protein